MLPRVSVPQTPPKPVIKQVARKLMFSPTIPYRRNILNKSRWKKNHNAHSVSQNCRAKREYVLARVFVSPVLSRCILLFKFATPRHAWSHQTGLVAISGWASALLEMVQRIEKRWTRPCWRPNCRPISYAEWPRSSTKKRTSRTPDIVRLQSHVSISKRIPLQIWFQVVNGRIIKSLGKDEFFIACRLVALAQHNIPPLRANMAQNVGLPVFHRHIMITKARDHTNWVRDRVQAVLSHTPETISKGDLRCVMWCGVAWRDIFGAWSRDEICEFI